jgi:hypothetical protein
MMAGRKMHRPGSFRCPVLVLERSGRLGSLAHRERNMGNTDCPNVMHYYHVDDLRRNDHHRKETLEQSPTILPVFPVPRFSSPVAMMILLGHGRANFRWRARCTREPYKRSGHFLPHSPLACLCPAARGDHDDTVTSDFNQ